MGQHLQLELRTVRAAFRTHPDDAVQAVVTHPAADILRRQRPPPRQQLCSTFASQKALDNFQLEICLILLYGTR
jgi:hypothetical protein